MFAPSTRLDHCQPVGLAVQLSLLELILLSWLSSRLLGLYHRLGGPGFTAVPCPYGPWMHMDVDWVYFEDNSDSAGDGGIPPDEMVWHGPWCVPITGVDDQGSQPCFFGDSDSSSSDNDGMSTSEDDDGATPPDDGDADYFAAGVA